MKICFPEDTTFPKSTYNGKKMVSKLGLVYEATHTCKNDYGLFWKEHEFAIRCPERDKPRYKDFDKGKKVASKCIARFFIKNKITKIIHSKTHCKRYETAHTRMS